MKTRRLPPPLAIALGWAACVVVLALLRGRLSSSPPAGWLAAALLVAGAILLWLVVEGRIGPSGRGRLAAAIVPGLLPLAMLVSAAGGLRSPAIGALALAVHALAAWRGLASGALAAAAGLAAVALTDLWLGNPPGLSALAAASAVLFVGGLLPVRHLRRSLADGAAARRELARVEGYVVRRRPTPPHAAMQAVSSPEETAVAERADRILRLRSLEQYLREVRDRTGADEVVLWREGAPNDAPRARATSTEGADGPRYFDEARWGPLRGWASEAEIVHADRSDDVVYCAAAPVVRDGRRYGALTITARAGLTLTHQGALEWAARYARHIGLLVELFEIRADRGRVRGRERALLAFVEAMHQVGTAEGAARSACDAALRVTAGDRAALVQWDARLEEGTVRAVTSGHHVAERTRVPAESVVGTQCAGRMPLHLADARSLVLSGAAIYGAEERLSAIGSLSVVPLVRDRAVVGAIVVESAEPEAISLAAQGSLGLLAFLAAASLPTFEQKDEAAQSARTDALTGLSNRRHFDEELTRVLADASRHRDETALVIADVDHFKRVNDSYGHEAGDAVLRHVTRLLQERVRPADLCARFGGEEIVILCPRTGLDGARLLAERLREAIAASPMRHGGLDITVTASFGVASHPRSVGDSDGLLGAADDALYEAKRDGRNRVKVASPKHDAALA
ncbi:MAG TPA: GGDEF domain-containing protein [Gemmatimonadaceae bacterium]